jgi:thioredoxin reductase
VAVVLETEVKEVANADGDRLALGCRNPDGRVEIVVEHLVVAIGRDPELGFMPGQAGGTGAIGDRKEFLHLIGDVRHGRMRQTAIAVGDGMVAAMAIIRKLGERRG